MHGGRPVSRGRDSQQHHAGGGRPGEEAGPALRRDGGEQDGQREHDERLHRHRRSGQPGGPARFRVGQGHDGVEQQAGRHGVFWMTPPDGNTPQRGRFRHGEHEALGLGRAKALGERVGGDQHHGRDEDLIGPGEQPRGRMMPHGDPRSRHRDPGQVHDRDDRDQDDGRSWQRDQLGGRGIQGGQVQVEEPLGPDQRPPQVIGQSPGRLPVVQRSPDRAGHPYDGHDDHGQQRKPPPDQPRRSCGSHRPVPFTHRAAAAAGRPPATRPRPRPRARPGPATGRWAGCAGRWWPGWRARRSSARSAVGAAASVHWLLR